MVAERTRYRLLINAHGLSVKRVWRILDCSHILDWNGCQMLLTIRFIIHSIIKRQSPCRDRSIYILWILCCQFPHWRIRIWRRRFLRIEPWNIGSIIWVIASKQTPALTWCHWPSIIYIIGHLFHIIEKLVLYWRLQHHQTLIRTIACNWWLWTVILIVKNIFMILNPYLMSFEAALA